MSSREEIVIIDDDDHVLELLKQVLEFEGYACRGFVRADVALKRIVEAPPIAIFLDVRMPDMDGFEFLHELRKSHPSVPVILMTGFADQDLFRQALKYRIDDFLAKPFSPLVVKESLKKVLGREESLSDHFLETVAHRLREARLALGLKQAEVAARCGMSTSQVSQIELRQSSPSVTTLFRLCKALNLKMTDLVAGF